MAALYQILDAGHDRNGNPRRVTVRYDGGTGRITGVHDHGYSGDGIPRGGTVQLPGYAVPFSEYRDLLKSHNNQQF